MTSGLPAQLAKVTFGLTNSVCFLLLLPIKLKGLLFIFLWFLGEIFGFEKVLTFLKEEINDRKNNTGMA